MTQSDLCLGGWSTQPEKDMGGGGIAEGAWSQGITRIHGGKHNAS